MKKLVFLLLLCACSLNLPASLPGNMTSPMKIEREGEVLTIYFESQGDEYSIVGIHPLSGREFFVQVKAGKIVKEEYGYIFSSAEVREILDELFKKDVLSE